MVFNIYYLGQQMNKDTNKFNLKKAFTLAEIMVTIAIVGAIAAITIPALNNSIQESQFNTGVQKAYSFVSQAFLKLQSGDTTNNLGLYPNANNDTVLRNQFCTVASCINTDTAANIFGINGTIYKGYKAGNLTLPVNNWPVGSINASAALSNGYFVFFASMASCNNYGVNACAWVYVDINGSNGPNMVGKDLYMFWITMNNSGSYSILPVGTSTDNWGHCIAGDTNASNGFGCTFTRLTNPNSLP